MTDVGYESLNAVVRAEIAHKNVVYGVCNATRMVKPEVIRSFAVALGRDSSDVMPIWTRAKEAMDRAAHAAKQAQAPSLSSWTELPLPTLMVRNLLEAQAKAVERLPYDMLGVAEPPLSAVYVRQSIRIPHVVGDSSTRKEMSSSEGPDALPPMSTSRHDGTQGTDTQLPVPKAMVRHRHLLITGEPGAGKSTLSSHLAWSLSRVWLRQDTSLEAPVDEPLLPVKVAAHTLLGETGSWSAVLSRAVSRSLGHSLIADPDPSLFRGRVQGARWMVLVDGLDEVADRESRAEVIRMIALHTRTDGDYRFVITSRPLPDGELAPLRGPSMGEYTMEPFGAKELKDFADKWFAAQYEDKASARAAAERFLGEVKDSRLQELAHNPLLATIAAVNATVDPTIPLPTSRLSLYQRFFGHLLTRRAGVRAELRRRYAPEPERLALHLWLDEQKRRLLGALGQHRLEGEESLLEAALAWVREHGRAHLVLEGWQTDVSDFLQGTGVLVQEQRDYRFLHHSFAEFFAARSYAEDIGPDFPDLESWILRAFHEDKRTLAMFVLCLWAEREECEADRIAERLRTGAVGGHERPLLAGLLLAEGVAFGEDNRRLLVERLENIGCCARDESDQEEAFAALGALGAEPGVLDRLERMARNELLGGGKRLLAVEAFGRCGPADLTEELLGEVLSGVSLWLGKAARVAVALGDRARELVRRRAWELATEPGRNSRRLSHAAQALAHMEMPEDAVRVARKVLEDASAGSHSIQRAAEAWLTAMPEAAQELTEIVMSWPPTDQYSPTAVGKALEKSGDIQAAARIALTLLRSDATSLHATDWAVSLWAKAQGQDARSEIRTAFERSGADAGHYLWVPARLQQELVGLGEVEGALGWADEAQAGGRWGTFGAGRAVKIWLEAGGLPAVGRVMERISRGRSLTPPDRPVVAEALLDSGALDEAGEVAELALRTPFCSRAEYEQATRVLLKAQGQGAHGATRLLEIWDGTPALADSSDWLQGVLQVLPYQEDDLEATGILARRLVALPAGDSDDVLRGLHGLLSLEGRDAVPYVIDTALTHPWVTWHQMRDLAAEFAALGERESALRLWKHALGFPDPPLGTELSLLIDMQAAGLDAEAAAHIEKLIAHPETRAPRRLRLRQLLAWLKAAGALPDDASVPEQRGAAAPRRATGGAS
ncbi:NACHT domain-containing protein [Streptomyces sp. NRRL S-244]|uniref:NACHT domain-containing protein n=1 Tax=Streptomyces sp. NRRL S-244 TaxID=1463897 RepID=UPI0004C1F249|nr:ATP-binding protein [Streptomyces sp. NRRL S-244]